MAATGEKNEASEQPPSLPIWGPDTPSDEIEILISEWECWMARTGSVRHAWIALGAITTRLSAEQHLRPWEIKLLTLLLERLLQSPSRFISAFGAARRRGAPKKSSIPLLLAGHRVQKYLAQGVPLENGRYREGWDGIGALSRVADDLAMSQAQVRRGHSRYKQKRAALHNSAAQQIGD